MRVISGLARGLRLESLEGMDTRPTLDRVKEALFSMLFDKVEDAVALDLFAGSGALGIEVLSRYGRECTFVDSNPSACHVVMTNLKKARLEDRAYVRREDFADFLSKTDKRFDIIFLDPPYDMGLYEEALSLIFQRRLLMPDGIVVMECRRESDISDTLFEIIRDKTYGKVRLCLLKERKA